MATSDGGEPRARLAARRDSIKARAGYDAFQQRRREHALEAQRAARGERLQLARVLAAERAEAAAAAAAGGAGVYDAEMAASTAADAGGNGEQQHGGGAAAPSDWAPADAAGLAGAELRRHYARQLMQPEWLTDVPPDLGSAWLALPRPEGRRCLVVAAYGATAVRSRAGALLARFQSALPGGSRRGGGGGGGHADFTVLDAVLAAPQGDSGSGGAEATMEDVPGATQQQHQQQEQRHGGASGQQLPLGSVLWVMDVLAWRGLALAGCTAECRLFMLAGKLAECGDGGGGGASAGSDAAAATAAPALRLLPAAPATPEGLAAAAAPGGACTGAALGFVQDGVLLLHREGAYQPGPTPLALLWKDARCSRYLLDTDADGDVPPRQQVVLRCLAADGGAGGIPVATADEPPVALARLPADWAARMGPRLLRPGRLLRFSVMDGGLSFGGSGGGGGVGGGRLAVSADLKYEGPANQRRGRADALSKALFQWMARAGEAPSLEALQRASAASAAAGAAAATGAAPTAVAAAAAAVAAAPAGPPGSGGGGGGGGGEGDMEAG